MRIGLVEWRFSQPTLHLDVWLPHLSSEIENTATLESQTSVTFHRCISAIPTQALCNYVRLVERRSWICAGKVRSEWRILVTTSAKAQRSGTVHRKIETWGFTEALTKGLFLYLQVLRLLKSRHNWRCSFLTTIRPWKLEHEAKCVNTINSTLCTSIPHSYIHALPWKMDGRMISIDPQSIHRLINCPNPKV